MPLLQTPDFSENSNFILPKKYAHRESYDKSKPTNILSPNCYQLLEPTCNIQNTDALCLLGNENKLHRNRNVLTQNTGSKRPSVVINKYPERQIEFLRPPIVPGTELFSEAFLLSKGQRDILIFTDSIPKGIHIRELNSFIKNSKTEMLSFPGATSKEVLHYLDVHLTNSSADDVFVHVGVDDLSKDNSKSKIEILVKNLRFVVEKCHTYGIKNVFISGLVYIARIGLPYVILHVGIDDLSKDNSQSKIEILVKNLRFMVEKCHTYGIKNVFISGLVYIARIVLPVLERTHEMIVHLCNKLGICYVCNQNIRRKHLWKDDLHLVESGKVILANNFVS